MIRIIPATDSDFVVLKIYKVYAAEVKGKFKLLNYFDETKLTLNHYNGDDVEFYSSPSKNLDKNEINEAVEFIKNFKKLYNISNNNKIKGIVANTMDECWALLGVPYTVYRSEKTYSGYAMTSGMVLVTRPNHLHELIHGVMMPLYPDAPLLLHEGIATYYAGGARKDYAYHKQNLKKYIAGNPIDLSAEEIFYTNKEIEGETYLTNIVGAMIIEYTLKNYGHDKVLQLFGKTYPEEVFEELGIKDINNWLYDLINQ